MWHVTSTLKRTITKSTLTWVTVLCTLRQWFMPGVCATSTTRLYMVFQGVYTVYVLQLCPTVGLIQSLQSYCSSVAQLWSWLCRNTSVKYDPWSSLVLLWPCPTLGLIWLLRLHCSSAAQLRSLITYSGHSHIVILPLSTTLGLYPIHSLPHLTVHPARSWVLRELNISYTL